MTKMAITGQQEIEIHRYRFIKGGKIETHKRSLWSFDLDLTFQYGHYVSGFNAPMFPDVLNQLRNHFQNEHVDVLTVPHVGRVLTIITEWNERIDGASIAGAEVSAKFLEHGTTAFGENELTSINSLSYSSKIESLRRAVNKLPRKPGLLDQILEAAGQILAIRDQALLRLDLISARIASFRGLVDEADRTLSELDNPDNFAIIHELLALLAATYDLIARPQAAIIRPKTYVVDQTSTIMEVADHIYGDPSRSRDLLQLNQFDDAMAIKAGTRVIYLPDSL